MATKKKAAGKKTVAKKGRTEEPVPGKYSFNILDENNADMVNAAKEGLDTIRCRRKNQPTGFKSMKDIRHSMVPLREFMLQWALGSYGLHEGILMEVIGREALGKTTLMMWLAGCAMSAGIPVMYQGTENKMPEAEWCMRAMHPDKAVAKLMFERMAVYEQVFELNQMDQNMMDWLNLMRGRAKVAGFTPVPLDTPLLVIVDTWSKLMSPGEAAGVYDYDKFMSDEQKKKKKATNEASNLGHSKWAHAWCRRLPSILAAYNVVLVLVQHQNEKVSMSSGGGSNYLPESVSALYNKEKIGGAATNQNAAVQIILGYKGMAKNGSGDKIGKYINGRVEKNNYGPENRQWSYMLQWEGLQDTETRFAPNLRFDEETAVFMADKGLLGTTASSKRYTCERIGAHGLQSQDFKELLDAHPEAIAEMGRILGIQGFDSTVDQLRGGVAGEDAESAV